MSDDTHNQAPPLSMPQPHGLMGPSTGSVPNPDPTQRTVEQLQREISATRQIVEANGRGTREVIETRLSGMDKAIDLLQLATNKLPEQIRGEVGQLRQLHDEKFESTTKSMEALANGIEKQFTERDKRTEQLSLADKTAIAAALQAQKEDAAAKNESNSTATTKMEANFAKQIDQTQQLLQEMRRSTDDKINDIKSRLDKGEGVQRGVQDNRTDNRLTVGSAASVAIAVFGGLSLIVAVTVVAIGSNSHGGGGVAPAAIAVTPIAPSALAPR